MRAVCGGGSVSWSFLRCKNKIIGSGDDDESHIIISTLHIGSVMHSRSRGKTKNKHSRGLVWNAVRKGFSCVCTQCLFWFFWRTPDRPGLTMDLCECNVYIILLKMYILIRRRTRKLWDDLSFRRTRSVFFFSKLYLGLNNSLSPTRIYRPARRGVIYTIICCSSYGENLPSVEINYVPVMMYFLLLSIYHIYEDWRVKISLIFVVYNIYRY